jgi:hypothetical protein
VPHAPAPKTGAAVSHLTAPGDLPGLWWSEIRDEAHKAALLIHAGLPTMITRLIWGDHDIAPQPRRTGTEPSAAAAPGHRLGNLSMKYETSCVPGQEGKAAATVSSGVNDAGGKSYGAYQMTSTADSGAVVLKFLKHEGAIWAAGFAGLDPTVRGGFEVEWKRVAALQPAQFFAAQHAFIERTHYDPVIASVLKTSKVDLSKAGDAVRDVIWSMSVQHGRAAKLANKAVGKVSGLGNPGEKAYDKALINALYDAREAYVDTPALKYLIKDRYVPERKAALKMLDDAR